MLKEPIHLFYQALYVLLYPVTVCAVLAIIVGFAEVVRFRSLTNFARTTWTLYLIGLPVGLVGYLIGFMVGDSRTGEIGSLVSAVLGVIAGLNIFAVSSDRAKRAMTGYGVCLLAVALFVGTLHGAMRRESTREERLKNLSEQEFRIRNHRKSLGLPEEVPDWMTTGEAK